MDKTCHMSFILFFSSLNLFGIQCLEHAIICLEEQQDEFDFKYQTHKMEGELIKEFWLHLHSLMVTNEMV